MLVLPTDHRVDLEKLESIFHKPVVIDSEEDLPVLFPDCSLGKMPPFGKLYGLHTYVDKSLLDKETIVFEAGTHTEAIKMKMSDYLRLAEGQGVDFSMKLHPMKAV
jgi:Ala-tRNA(Pro) deacylase